MSHLKSFQTGTRRRQLSAAILFAVFGIGSIGKISTALAADPPTPSIILQGFYETVLWNDRSHLQQLTKWTQPLRIKITNATGASELTDFAIRHTRAIAKIAGLSSAILSPDDAVDNFVISFLPDANASASRRLTGACGIGLEWTRQFTLRRSVILVRTDLGPHAAKTCLIREIMHGFGFFGLSEKLDTVRNPQKSFVDLTPLDLQMVKILYDPALTPGMHIPEALQAARHTLFQAPRPWSGSGGQNDGWDVIGKAMARIAVAAQDESMPARRAMANLEIKLMRNLGLNPMVEDAERVQWNKIAAEISVMSPVPSAKERP